MEDNKKFELSDENLEQVAGGYGDEYWPEGTRVYIVGTNYECPCCGKKQNGYPQGTVVTGGSTGVTVQWDCCGRTRTFTPGCMVYKL